MNLSLMFGESLVMPNKNDYDVNDRLWKNAPLFLKKKVRSAEKVIFCVLCSMGEEDQDVSLDNSLTRNLPLTLETAFWDT